MHEFKHPQAKAKVLAIGADVFNDDMSLVHGFEYDGAKLKFFTASEGGILQSHVAIANFDTQKVIAELC